ncbi:23S ribosomal RNA methyltransferase [Obba rivulosa]|uniref:rRNA methyltransferase 2, mitochondrial n=1 Tax=Obba rivulosa TaxID=1052685 RepID=A0A8E2AYW1_9APHY|nr:23S ribosomal RNA methyltransferase [Obba rivulosa]
MSFVATRPALSHKMPPSSVRWVTRQLKDPYVRERSAHPVKFRARSAFKLMEIDNQYTIFKHQDVHTVVDLGAAPGAWSQVVAYKLGWLQPASHDKKVKLPLSASISGFGVKEYIPERWIKDGPAAEDEFLDPLADLDEAEEVPQQRGRGAIIALDLIRMSPIPGVQSIQQNFLHEQAHAYLDALLKSTPGSNGMADIILSDMAANATGSRAHDVGSCLEIAESVFNFTKTHLRAAESIGRRRGGVLVMKYFAHPLMAQFSKELLEPNFHYVHINKPRSSRSESSECYWICMGWKGSAV